MLKNKDNASNKAVWDLLISLDLTQINLEELLVLGTFENSFAYMSEHQGAQNFNEFINFSVTIPLDII